MASAGMNNLTTLIKRLEAATSRLEDIASSALPQNEHNQGPSTSAVAFDKAASPTQVSGERSNTYLAASGLSDQPSSSSSNQDLPPQLQAFESILSDDLQLFQDSCEAIGGHVTQQGQAFCDVFRAQKQTILVASKSKKPNQSSPTYQKLLKPLFDGVGVVIEIKDKHRKDPLENHLCMLEAGAQVIGWVQLDSPPDSFIDDTLGSAQFYGNKILREFREKDQSQVNWVKTFVKLIGSLKSYIKQHHPNGLSWNPQGIELDEALKAVDAPASHINGVNATASAAAGVPAPPPPPPPPPPLPSFDQPSSESTAKGAGQSDMGAVFEQLNRGEAVTAGLRKVDKSQMTHKNPSLRSQGSQSPLSHGDSSRGKSPTPPVKQKPESMRLKKPSRKILDGNKWILEQFENEMSPIDIDTERQHSILISRCKSATIRVNGKANAISVDNCSRVDVIVDSLVSSLDVINCGSFRMQVTGTMPAIQLDKVDGATIYLSKESLGAEIFTSKCSSINITLPPLSEQGDSIECPIPEQIKSFINKDGKVVSEIVKQEG